MTALCFCVFSVLNDIAKVSCELRTSGISVKTLLREREKYLFDRYCREVNEEFFAKMENQSNRRKTCNDSFKRVQEERRKNITNIDIEYPEEVEEASPSGNASKLDPKTSSDDFLSCERNDFSRDVSTISETYWTAADDSNQVTLVPSLNLKTDSAPTSPLDDLTLQSETSDSRDSFVIPMIEEHTGREETMDDLISTFIEVTDNAPVFTENNIKEFEDGEMVTVTGRIRKSCETFSINLCQGNESRDIALHINPRFPQNYIVRNSRVKDIWGIEEIASPLPFSLERGSRFNIQILVNASSYFISINGRHFAGFSHRIPVKLVNCLEVKGDVEDITIDRHITTVYPEDIEGSEPIPIEHRPYKRVDMAYLAEKLKQTKDIINPPYYGKLNELFIKGKRLQILGKIKMLPHSFYINLQNGHKIWPHPEIAFHFNPRFAKANVGKHIICKNAWYNGKWDQEERTEIAADFCPGKPFNLEIVCHQQTYEVILNSKVIAEFYFRVEPDKVDTIYIQGDIKIWDVSLSTISLVKS